ncbi:MAG: PIN domain-containing protein [Burkholderiales bacterium]|nr:PIN domain-containing protein [Burkholderiales bacterium]
MTTSEETAAVGQLAEAGKPWNFVPEGPALIDSGPLLALFNAADAWHARVVDWLRQHPDIALVSTWPVLTEVCALLARRMHNQAALDFLLWVERGGVQVDTPATSSLAQMRRLAQRFASLPFDLADASIAEAAERLGLRRILSIDADFDVYRDARGRPLANLLRP